MDEDRIGSGALAESSAEISVKDTGLEEPGFSNMYSVALIGVGQSDG